MLEMTYFQFNAMIVRVSEPRNCQLSNLPSTSGAWATCPTPAATRAGARTRRAGASTRPYTASWVLFSRQARLSVQLLARV